MFQKKGFDIKTLFVYVLLRYNAVLFFTFYRTLTLTVRESNELSFNGVKFVKSVLNSLVIRLYYCARLP